LRPKKGMKILCLFRRVHLPSPGKGKDMVLKWLSRKRSSGPVEKCSGKDPKKREMARQRSRKKYNPKGGKIRHLSTFMAEAMAATATEGAPGVKHATCKKKGRVWRPARKKSLSGKLVCYQGKTRPAAQKRTN